MKQFLLSAVSTFLPAIFNWLNSGDSGAQSATEFALTYVYPIPSYANFSLGSAQNPDCNDALPVNTLCLHTKLADYTFREVVRPNVDTLYSEGLIDLSHSDVEIVVPPISEDRFWVLAFYDLYASMVFCLLTLTDSVTETTLLTSEL